MSTMDTNHDTFISWRAADPAKKKNYLLFYCFFWQLDFITAMALGAILSDGKFCDWLLGLKSGHILSAVYLQCS